MRRSPRRSDRTIPELPDVHVLEEHLAASSLHRRIERVHAERGRELKGTTPDTLRRHLRGRSLSATRRHGKHLFADIEADDRWLRLHFGMTGSLRSWSGEEPEDLAHVRLRLDFQDGSGLAYQCQRRFGEIGLVHDAETFIEEQGLGPDLLSEDLSEERFLRLLEGRRGGVKSALLDQKLVAGLGNVYADEVLFQAAVHPETALDQLDDRGRVGLLRVGRRVVRRAMDRGAEPARMPRTWLLPRREEGQACPRCHGTIDRIEVGGRTTYLCARHQAASG